MNKVRKRFDTNATMRSIRDKVSIEIEGLTLEQEVEWLASQELADPYLKRLQDSVVQLRVAADGASRRS
jgi:hypothetical protein